MGAFCIYGISRQLCLANAEKKTSTWNDQEKRPYSILEWTERRDKLATTLFELGTRAVKVSPEFDTPQFCMDWLKIDPLQIRDAVLMVRGPKRDKNGGEVLKGGAVVETWLVYAEECKRPEVEVMA